MPYDTKTIITPLAKGEQWRVEAVDDPNAPPQEMGPLLDLEDLAVLLDTTTAALMIRVSKAKNAGKPWPLPPVAPGWGTNYRFRFRERDVYEWLAESAEKKHRVDTAFRILNRGLAYCRDAKLSHAARGLMTFILSMEVDEVECDLQPFTIYEKVEMTRHYITELVARGYIVKQAMQFPKSRKTGLLYLVSGTPDPAQQEAAIERAIEHTLRTGSLMLGSRMTQPLFIARAFGLQENRFGLDVDPALADVRAGRIDRATVLANAR